MHLARLLNEDSLNLEILAASHVNYYFRRLKIYFLSVRTQTQTHTRNAYVHSHSYLFSLWFLFFSNMAEGLGFEAHAHTHARRHTITSLISLSRGINVITGDLYRLRY